MAKVRLNPLLADLRGRVKGMVFRLTPGGQLTAYMKPDMSRVRWSPAQQAHRERFAEASAYARAALADPGIRAIYEEMSLQQGGVRRPYAVALSDYFHGNNLLGERFRWNAEAWRAVKRLKKRRRS